MNKRLSATLLVSAYLFPAYSQLETGEQKFYLDTIQINATNTESGFDQRADGTISMSSAFLMDLPEIMGNADPIHYVQMLPGVQTNAEYTSGLHINGSDNGHNLITIQGVPIYNAGHLLGIFSTFNPTHYADMQLRRSTSVCSTGNSLGGELTMELPCYPYRDTVGSHRPDGDISIGLLSSQGSVHLPLSRRSDLKLSLRSSYINLLYSKWLESDDVILNYRFSDINATYQYNIDPERRLMLDFYCGHDYANTAYNHSNVNIDMDADWGNRTGAIHLISNRQSGTLIKHTVYSTELTDNTRLEWEQTKGSGKHGIHDIGYHGTVQWPYLEIRNADRLGLVAGANVIYHRVRPLIPELYNAVSYLETSFENSLFSQLTVFPSSNTSVSAGLRYTFFEHSGYRNQAADPSLTAQIFGPDNRWSLSMNIAQSHQYLFQMGVCNTGLPIEFWKTADSDHKAQYMREIRLDYVCKPTDKLELSAELFGKLLYNQIEYVGSIMDLSKSDYTLESSMMNGEGYNWGGSVMLSGNAGPVNGWISYSYCKAQRRFPREGVEGWYPASHERMHEIDGVAVFNTRGRIKPSLTAVYASGTPFTAVNAVYMIDGSLVSSYSSYNGNRLRPYFRVDAAVDFCINEHSSINLSLYNLSCRRNDIYYGLKYYRNEFYYSHVTFFTAVLPSLSYHITF